MCTMQLFGSMHAALLEYSLDTTFDKIEKCLQSGCTVQGRAGWGRGGGGGGVAYSTPHIPKPRRGGRGYP